jgi:hypothetical protein
VSASLLCPPSRRGRDSDGQRGSTADRESDRESERAGESSPLPPSCALPGKCRNPQPSNLNLQHSTQETCARGQATCAATPCNINKQRNSRADRDRERVTERERERANPPPPAQATCARGQATCAAAPCTWTTTARSARGARAHTTSRGWRGCARLSSTRRTPPRCETAPPLGSAAGP